MYGCPVCKKYEFDESGDSCICKVCGWENDPVQDDHPDWGGFANQMSLNEAREAYKSGEKVE